MNFNEKMLDNVIHNPCWAEVVRLYSGLFNTQEEREDFILGLAQLDILLVAECKSSWMKEERNLSKELIEEANRDASIFLDFSKSFKSILT